MSKGNKKSRGKKNANKGSSKTQKSKTSTENENQVVQEKEELKEEENTNQVEETQITPLQNNLATSQNPFAEAIIVKENDSPNIQKLRSLLGKPFKIKVNDGRELIGKLYCVDREENIILSETEEKSFRKIPIKNSSGTKFYSIFFFFH